MIGALYIPDLLRGLAILVGGATFGIGIPVLWERRRQLHGRNRHSELATILLLAVHLLVMVYVAGNLFARWHSPLTWRVPVALMIFVLKATLLYQIRLGAQLDAVTGRYRDPEPRVP